MNTNKQYFLCALIIVARKVNQISLVWWDYHLNNQTCWYRHISLHDLHHSSVKLQLKHPKMKMFGSFKEKNKKRWSTRLHHILAHLFFSLEQHDILFIISAFTSIPNLLNNAFPGMTIMAQIQMHFSFFVNSRACHIHFMSDYSWPKTWCHILSSAITRYVVPFFTSRKKIDVP